ncbi:MAG: nucleotide exchange factor GrpE [Christensenellaceae bacterium]|jgi:molecular chaperone GrpE|nr:nucleotide exchange factor GrpE [Christensenellaceae bacterium]
MSEKENKKKCGNPKCDCEVCECGEGCVCGMSKEEAQTKIDEIIKQRDEYLKMAQYLKADFENYKKRNQEASVNAFRDGVASAAMTLIPVFDGAVDAIKAITNENDKRGFQMLVEKFEMGFETLGLTKIKSVGEKFDPNLHNAVAVGHHKDKEDDEILEEWQVGFTHNGKTIRPSMVKVNKLEN